MAKRKLHKRMYAVSCEGIGLIAGTLSYNRRAAICHFQGGGFMANEWEQSKRAGYRTVVALVKIIRR